MSQRLIRLIEVPSELAGAKIGASGGIEALKVTCDESSCEYFKKYPTIRIKDENHALKNPSPYKHAKYIDHLELVLERLASSVQVLRKENFFPIVMAGDHSTAAGTMAGLLNAHEGERIGVVWIDAHADMHTPYTTPSGNMHGMPLAIALGEDNLTCKINDLSKKEKFYWERLKSLSQTHIRPQDIVYCAIRDCEEAEIDFLKQNGIKNYSTEQITYEGVINVAKSIMEDLSECDHIYISFDVDSIDPLYMPGTGTPVDMGLSFEQALCLNLELIKNKKVCCWEMAEINPSLDKQNISGRYSFEILDKVTSALIEHY
ncbi:MAG: arginase [Proteobacteria bacterium]|nr:MAG: arginase [Pseudomonadota bacterium]